MNYAKIIFLLTLLAIAADYLELKNDCDGKYCTAANSVWRN